MAIWTGTLTRSEVDYTEEAFSALREIQWASPLTRKIEQHGGVALAPTALRVEMRIAHALHQAGRNAEYEFRTEVGTKSVDFRVEGSPEWFIEIVSLTASEAVRNATQGNALLTSVALSSLSADPRQSEEGEVVRAIERIADKAAKFPSPSPWSVHVVLVDMRGYGIGMSDRHDYREIAYGARAVREECHHYWEGRPIAGLFDPKNARNSARLAQERIHYLGFIKEKDYCEGEIECVGYYLPNPKFFKTNECAAAQLRCFPLRFRQG
jgi:hypothetical protein